MAIHHLTWQLSIFPLWMPLPPSIALDLIEEEFKPIFSSFPRKLVCSECRLRTLCLHAHSGAHLLKICLFERTGNPSRSLSLIIYRVDSKTADKHILAFDMLFNCWISTCPTLIPTQLHRSIWYIYIHMCLYYTYSAGLPPRSIGTLFPVFPKITNNTGGFLVTCFWSRHFLRKYTSTSLYA